MIVLPLAVVMAVVAGVLGWFFPPIWETDRRKAAVGTALVGFVATLVLWFAH